MSPTGLKTYAAFGEHMDWSFYDTLTIPAAGTEFSLFQVPIGQGGKVLWQTNMTTAGVMPNNIDFTVRAIRATYLEHALKVVADVDAFYAWLATVTVRLFVNGKDALFSKPLAELMGIPLTFHWVSAATTNDIIMSMARPSGVTVLNVPIPLAAQTNFEVRINYPAAAAANIQGDFLRISLDGFNDRAS